MPGRQNSGGKHPDGRHLMRKHPWYVLALLILLLIPVAWWLTNSSDEAIKDPRVTEAVPGDRCDGDLIGERSYERNGELVAVSRVWYDAASGRSCAKMTKAKSHQQYEITSYIAVRLCNEREQCGEDMNYYAREAGPVHVSSGPNDCLTVAVSQLSDDRRRWLVEPQEFTVSC